MIPILYGRKWWCRKNPATNDNGWDHTNVGVFEELKHWDSPKTDLKPEPKKVVGKRRNL